MQNQKEIPIEYKGIDKLKENTVYLLNKSTILFLIQYLNLLNIILFAHMNLHTLNCIIDYRVTTVKITLLAQKWNMKPDSSY